MLDPAGPRKEPQSVVQEVVHFGSPAAVQFGIDTDRRLFAVAVHPQLPGSGRKQLLRIPGRSTPNRNICRAQQVCVRLTGAATEDGTMKAALQNYHARMRRVLHHIDRHLDALSSVAAYSKYHFSRIGRIKAHLATGCTEAGAVSISELIGRRAKEWAEKPVEA